MDVYLLFNHKGRWRVMFLQATSILHEHGAAPSRHGRLHLMLLFECRLAGCGSFEDEKGYDLQ